MDLNKSEDESPTRPATCSSCRREADPRPPHCSRHAGEHRSLLFAKEDRHRPMADRLDVPRRRRQADR